MLITIILTAKQRCDENGTSLSADIRSGCIDALSDYDLTALFSNLLENAVEATENIPDSFIELAVTPHNENDFLVTVINSCRENPFDSSHRLISSKQDRRRHGYGMKSIHRIVEKYNGTSESYFDETNYTFHTVINLKIPSWPDPLTVIQSTSFGYNRYIYRLSLLSLNMYGCRAGGFIRKQ